MNGYLGLDTSNYTTSVAVYSNSTVLQKKKLLPVKHGTVGLRQSDAVFLHTQQLSALIDELFSVYTGDINAVGVSTRPRSIEGSYMPCFTVGSTNAHILATVLGVPLYEFSHQQGHIVAALYSAEKLELLSKTFLAFHVSGGTTEALIVKPDKNNIITATPVGVTLDLNAGQIVDRVGVMLGLRFPCGTELEKLALRYNEKLKVKSTLKGTNCCLSGVENKCEKIFNESNSPEKTAAYALAYIEQTLMDMYKRIIVEHGSMPVLFSGGVMSNSIIRNSFTEKLGAIFSQPEFSSDNAGGISVLTAIKDGN